MNNVQSRSRTNSVVFSRIPGVVDNRLNRRVFNGERVGLVVDGYRRGYSSYNRSWRDDDFCYPFYVFDPFRVDRCVSSPFYYYVSCPAYISYDRVIFVDDNRYERFDGYNYSWSRNNNEYVDGDNKTLDYAVDDIVSAYEDVDTNKLDNLVPSRGRVRIYGENRFRYSIDARDFYDLLRDGITTPRTDRYRIIDVKWDGRNQARVTARHEYRDNRDEQRTVYHSYTLIRERGQFVIREFGTSSYQP